MTTQRLHNKALFAAALAVYLGLVLAGAPPQVLAQTAATSGKPNELSRTNVQPNSVEFNKRLRALAASGKLDVFDVSIKANADDAFSNLQTVTASGDQEAVALFEDFLRVLASSAFKGFSATQVEWTLRGDQKDFDSSVTLEFDSEQQASKVASGANLIFQVQRQARKNTPESVFIESTKVEFRNNQVFIVTRLPRAALDSLITGDEKAN